MAEQERKTNPAMVLAAWVIVLIPAGWGVSRTVITSMNLFKPPEVVPVPQAVPPANTPASPQAGTPRSTPANPPGGH